MTSGSESRRDDQAIRSLAELARGVAETPADPELDRAGRARLLFNVRRELERPSRRVALPLALAAALGIEPAPREPLDRPPTSEQGP